MIVDLKTFAPPPDPRGFIVLEGVNGAGKTTVQAALAELITSRGGTVHRTREPGGTELGRVLRSLVLETHGPVPLAEALIFAADRAQHVGELVRPALERGEWVISDRYLYSSVAFQGYGRELDPALIAELSRIATEGLVPDLVVLLDLDPAEGLRRAANRGGTETDRFEEAELEFHGRLRHGYLELAKSRTEPFLVVDASLPIDEVRKIVVSAVGKLLDRRGARP